MAFLHPGDLALTDLIPMLIVLLVIGGVVFGAIYGLLYMSTKGVRERIAETRETRETSNKNLP